MLFISDVHHGLDSLKLLPKTKEPIVILGDLINWIDYRNGDGIAKDVFGDANLNRLIELRKDHNFDERKNLWQDLFSDDPDGKQQKIEDAIERQYLVVFDVLFRILKVIYGSNVTYVRNITDVDDKIIEAAHKKKLSINEITNKITKLSLLKKWVAPLQISGSTILIVPRGLPLLLSLI